MNARALLRILLGLAAALLVVAAVPAMAGRTLVAVAANFTAAAQDIATAFEAQTGHRAVLAFGSTGKLYAQLSHGAPYEVFLAADGERPRRAVEDGLAVAGTRVSYAVGRIVLFSADETLVDPEAAVLREPKRFARLAIANPETAPYGAAAVAALHELGVYDRWAGQLVRGDSIAQTYQFVATGNAALGFVARSQLVGVPGGSRWLVPQRFHPPIRQDAVLLKTGADRPAAWAFLGFLQGAEARAIIERHGYGVGGSSAADPGADSGTQ